MAILPPLPEHVWLLIVLIGGTGLLAILHAFGSEADRRVEVHDLKVRVHELRNEQLERIRRIRQKAIEESELAARRRAARREAMRAPVGDEDAADEPLRRAA